VAQLLDGKSCARAVRTRIRREISQIAPQIGYPPQVVFIQVGDIAASTAYVNSKSAMAQKVGMLSTIVRLRDNISEDELLEVISAYNSDPLVHGLLVQLPLPQWIDTLAVASAIDPAKDVDCFNPINVGRLALGMAGPRPATPQGVIMLLEHYGLHMGGLKAVVVGRSNLVGKPMGVLLLQRNATVTVCHSGTHDIPRYTKEADIVVVAAGKPGLLTGEMVKPGVIVVDVGINYVDTGEDGQSHVKGDVDYATVEPLAAWISPVPGGVGPMTIASVLWNGLQLYRAALGSDSEQGS
jgi:methylenetetrahydrofolate dehydrogenase (NADP+)/methenyltetrahydrofolate cyclohydrolase